VLAVGALLRGLLFFAAAPALLNNADGQSFLKLVVARSNEGDALHPPGYPIFARWVLDLAGSDVALTIAQHLLGLAAAALLYAAVRLLRGTRWVAGGTALVAAASGDVVVLAHTYVSETLFLFLVALAIFLVAVVERGAARRALPLLMGLAAIAGAALACGVVVRTVGLLLLPVLGVWLLGRRPSLRSVAVLLAGATGVAAVFVPYLVHREATVGKASFSVSAGWSAYGRIAQIADCNRITVTRSTARLCEPGPTGASHRPDVRAAWFSPEVSRARKVFGGPPRGDDVLGQFASAVDAGQTADVWTLRLRDVIRSGWPAFARRRAFQVGGPGAEYPVDLRWPDAESGSMIELQNLGLASRMRVDDDRLVTAAHVQDLTRFWPWLMWPALVLVVLALARGRGLRRPVALMGSSAFVLVAGAAAIQLYNPRYAVPAEPLIAAAGLFAAQALGLPARSRAAADRAAAWGRSLAVGDVLRGVPTRATARAARVPRVLWLVLAGAVLLRVAVTLGIRPAITDRGAVAVAVEQGRQALWTDLAAPPVDALWARVSTVLGLGPGFSVTVVHLVGLVGVALVFAAARRLGAPVWAAALAAAIVGLDPDRALQEHVLAVPDLTVACAMGAVLLLLPGSRRRRTGRLLAGGTLLAVLLLHLPEAQAGLVLVLAAAAAVALAWRRRPGARRPALSAALLAGVVPVCVLGVTHVDRWDVGGGPAQSGVAAPFARYVAAVQRDRCPSGLAPDLKVLCAGPRDDLTLPASAARVRAAAPRDAARQRWLLDRWLQRAEADAWVPPAAVAGLWSSWRGSWLHGGALRPLDAERRENPSAPWLVAAATATVREVEAEPEPSPRGAHRIGEPSRADRLREARALRDASPRAAPAVTQHAPLGALDALQDVVRETGVRTVGAILLGLLAVLGAVRRPPAALLVGFAAIVAVAPPTPRVVLLATALLVVAAAVGAGAATDLLRRRPRASPAPPRP
jgi:hypothetical protein